MSEEGRARFEIPKDMQSMAEASFAQARKAFENFLSSAQQAASWIAQAPSWVTVAASPRRVDKHLEIGLGVRLPNELVEPLWAQGAVHALSGHAVSGDDAFCFGHGTS